MKSKNEIHNVNYISYANREQREMLKNQRKAFMRFARIEREKAQIAESGSAHEWHIEVMNLNIAYAKNYSRKLREYWIDHA